MPFILCVQLLLRGIICNSFHCCVLEDLKTVACCCWTDISPLLTLNLPGSLLWNPIFEYASSNALRPWRLRPIDSAFECVEVFESILELKIYWIYMCWVFAMYLLGICCVYALFLSWNVKCWYMLYIVRAVVESCESRRTATHSCKRSIRLQRPAAYFSRKALLDSKSPFILEDAIRILMPEKERWIEGKTPGELKKMGSTHWIIENDLEGKISKSIQVRMNYVLILVDDCVVYETIHCVKSQCWRLSQNLHWRLRGEPKNVELRPEWRYCLRWRLKTDIALKTDILMCWRNNICDEYILFWCAGEECCDLIYALISVRW